ncbi:MAG TPA: protein kinase [Polyangiaceae bacterium]
MVLRDDVAERATARIGAVLKGKWRLDAVIGIGGMASVYAATHRNQARVAIKMLHPEVALDKEVTARFLREGYVANAVGHPGTVTVLDDDISEDGAPFLVMELLLGQTLDALLAAEPEGLHVDRLLPWMDQVLSVLVAAHERGIVHRDLKPENLFLTSDGRLKVLDFGIARLREISAQSAAGTRAGSVLGTPAFMSPEQALGRWQEVDGRTDIWAVGATLFTLLTGRFVHEAETIQEQLVLSATCPAPRLRNIASYVSTPIADVVDRALEFQKGARFDNASAMQLALRDAATQSLGASAALGWGTLPSASSARLSTPDEVHGATLVAPPGFTPAITAMEGRRGDSVTTGSAVIQPVRESRPPRARGWLIGGGVALALVAAIAAVRMREPAMTPPKVSALAQETATTAPLAPPPATVAHVPAETNVAPPPTVIPLSSSAPPEVAHLVHPLAPRAPSAHPSAKQPISVEKKPPPPSGEQNPFDRRY